MDGPTYGFVHGNSVHGIGKEHNEKIKLVVPVLGSRGKSLSICVMLSHCLFSVF